MDREYIQRQADAYQSMADWWYCARLDFFTEYGIDTMSMGPNDYCSKWEAR